MLCTEEVVEVRSGEGYETLKKVRTSGNNNAGTVDIPEAEASTAAWYFITWVVTFDKGRPKA